MALGQRDDASRSADVEPAAEMLIAKIDVALARAGTHEGVIRVGDHLDALLDLRLAAQELATLASLDGALKPEWFGA